MKKNFFYAVIILLISSAFNSCQKEISEESGKTDIPSVGSLKDTSGNCLSSIITGTFYNGVLPGGDTANVLIQVNVITPGTYHIYTDMQNGFSFSDTGFFTTPGINLVTLRPSGTPILPVTTNFTVTYDTSICSFSVDVQDSTGLGGGGTGGSVDSTNLSDTAWKFSDDMTNYNGPVDTAFVKDTLGQFVLNISGHTVSTGDSGMVISLVLPSADISAAVGLEFSTTSTAAFQFLNFTGSIYSADPTTIGFEIKITITSFDTATKIVTGTFSGTAKDSSGNTINITNGSFKVKVA